MTFVLSVGGPGFVTEVGAVDSCGFAVELTGGCEEEAADADVKCMVIIEGFPCTVVRDTVIGMAGLWYLRRGRYVRQNFLSKRQHHNEWPKPAKAALLWGIVDITDEFHMYPRNFR
jgi:hypothetical protein